MKIIFMGTPDFSVPVLDALVEAGHEVIAVITQPDKPKGRGKAILMTPVKEKALEYQIPVYQPVKVRESSFVEFLKGLNPDVMVVIAFGQILPKEVLDIPKYGCINVHASLLPKYRGAAPIQWVIIDGEPETGITTMLMDEGLDTGDMLEKVIIPIGEKETGGSLHDKLSLAGKKIIISTLNKLQDGTLIRYPQADDPKISETCYARRLEKSLGNIDWTMSADQIERLIRGLNPWPSAYTKFNQKTVKIWSAEVLPDSDQGQPGEVIHVDKNSLLIKTGSGILSILELQPEGKKKMTIDAFLRGYPVETGQFFQHIL